MESTAPELLYSGAWGAGKSRVLCEKVLFLCLRYPGNFVGICRKTYASLRFTTMKTWFEEVCPVAYIKEYNKTEHLVTLKNGSQVLFFGLDDPLKIQSLNLGSCGVDEVVELTEEDWLLLGGRLRYSKVPFHQQFAATNPAHQQHWLYKRFYQEKLGRVVESNSLENPHLPADYVAKIQTLTGRYRERFVLGKWVGFEGLVYDCYDPLVHLINWQRFKELTGKSSIPADWPRVRSIDFGYTNPFVCQWWAISPDGEWFRYREIYETKQLVEDVAKRIVKLSEGENIEATFADHDAEDRATLHRHGVKTMPAKKDVVSGIKEAYKMLQLDERGRPRLYLLDDALVNRDPALVDEKLPTCTEEELTGYCYPKATAGHNPKEEPVKENDHGCDALRYAIYSYDRWKRRRQVSLVGGKRG